MQNSSEHVILFVCVENTFRSIMSEAIFNAKAPEGWHAESAGVQAAEAINPLAVELLREIGIEIGAKTPRLVSKELVTRAWRVITFGCVDRCPIGAKEKAKDWPIPGSTGKSMKELRELREELQSRILNLIKEIEALKP
jgi:arsenate reductase